MKKYLSLLAMFAMIFATSSLFVACGGDDFEDDANNGNVDNETVEVSVVGVWECTNVDWETDYPETVMMEIEIQIGEKVYFNSDGTYSTENGITGKWTKKGNYLNIIRNAKNAVALDYKIDKLTSTELAFSTDIQIGKMRFGFIRVNNNVNNQKGTSGLVGRWKVTSDITITDAGKKLTHEPGAIWVFTDKTLTIYDENDLYSGNSVEYTFRDNEIICSGFPKRKVESLTETQMVLTCKTYANYDQTVTLVREE